MKKCSRKNCSRAGQELSFSEFAKDNAKKSTIRSNCRECGKRDCQNWHRNNKEKDKKYNIEHYDKQKAANYYLENKEHIDKRNAEYHERMMKTVVGRIRNLMKDVRSRSQKYQYEIDIDSDWLIKRFDENEGKCEISDIPFVLKGRSPFSISIDRIDATKGYTKDNVRLVCLMINFALNNFGDTVFFQMCEAVTNKQKTKGSIKCLSI